MRTLEVGFSSSGVLRTFSSWRRFVSSNGGEGMADALGADGEGFADGFRAGGFAGVVGQPEAGLVRLRRKGHGMARSRRRRSSPPRPMPMMEGY